MQKNKLRAGPRGAVWTFRQRVLRNKWPGLSWAFSVSISIFPSSHAGFIRLPWASSHCNEEMMLADPGRAENENATRDFPAPPLRHPLPSPSHHPRRQQRDLGQTDIFSYGVRVPVDDATFPPEF